MTSQLDLFTSAVPGTAVQPDSDAISCTESISCTKPVLLPAAGTAEAASRPEQHDHAGQPGDDGSLHWMLTGKPEPRPA